MTGPPLLTTVEHKVIELVGLLPGLLERVVDVGPSRRADLAEVIAHVHAIQNAVLAQAAARAYPDRYRLLGS